MSEMEKRCENCVHWEAHEYGSYQRQGTCMLTETTNGFSLFRVKAKAYCDGDHVCRDHTWHAWLETSEDFYCSQYEEKASPQNKAEPFDSKTSPLLAPQVRELLRDLWFVILSRAIKSDFKIKEVKVLVSTEGKGILQLDCDADFPQALTFWDNLKADLHLFYSLSLEDLKYLTKISLRIYCAPHGIDIGFMDISLQEGKITSLWRWRD